MTQPSGPEATGETRTIVPLVAPPDATVQVPGSKSITNRALLVAALAAGRSTLRGVLFADDTEAMLGCLHSLGIGLTVDREAATIVVEGCAGALPPASGPLDARMAGTVGRFLPAVLATGTGTYLLDGSGQLRSRPLGPLVGALRSLGAEVHERGAPGCLPLEIVGRGPDTLGSTVALAADVSSQFLSGLMLAAPLWPQGLEISLTTTAVSRPYLDMTAAVMAAFGAHAEVGADRIVVAPGSYRAADYLVEPDASAASYFFAAAAVTGGRVRVEGLGRSPLQGDAAFVDVLATMGATVERDDHATTVTGPPRGTLAGIEVDLADLSDVAPTLAAVAAFASSPTRIGGIGFIRRKESDRIGAVVHELRRLGVDAEEEPDGMVIRPTGAITPATVATYDDHRLAMSFAVIGLVHPGVVIADPGVVAKTFPTFWSVLDTLRAPGDRSAGRGAAAGVIAIDGPAGTGKTTVARAVAARLGVPYLDTGAMYRAVTFAALRAGVDPADAAAVGAISRSLHFSLAQDGQLEVDGVDATAAIRGPEVTGAVSVVAANPEVRAELRHRQRAWVDGHGAAVVEGRDMGTVVFPEARLKVFLTAAPEVRARRRAAETSGPGGPGGADVVAVATDLARRDHLDSTRADSPLAEAADAVVIDTGDLTIDDVVEAVVGLLHEGDR